LFCNRTVGLAGASSGEIQLVGGRACATKEGSLVGDWDQGQPTAKLCSINFSHQAANGRHGLKLVAMHTTRHEQVRPVRCTDDLSREDFHWQ
jgi:hypothetical protein